MDHEVNVPERAMLVPSNFEVERDTGLHTDDAAPISAYPDRLSVAESGGMSREQPLSPICIEQAALRPVHAGLERLELLQIVVSAERNLPGPFVRHGSDSSTLAPGTDRDFSVGLPGRPWE
jgi:hypothetical protein